MAKTSPKSRQSSPKQNNRSRAKVNQNLISKVEADCQKLETEVTLLRETIQQQKEIMKNKDDQIRELTRPLEKIFTSFETLQKTVDNSRDRQTSLQLDLQRERLNAQQQKQQLETLQQELDKLLRQQAIIQEKDRANQVQLTERERIVHHLREENTRLQQKLTSTNRQLRDLFTHLENLMQSKSWILTAPIRKIAAFFRSCGPVQSTQKKN